MKEGKGNTVLLTVIGIATLLVAVVGATFAYFSAQVEGNNNKTVTVSTGNGGSIGYTGGEVIDAQDIYPRAEAWVQKPFTITYTPEAAPIEGNDVVYKYQFALVYNSTFGSTNDAEGHNGGYLKYTITSGACSVSNVASTPEKCDDANGTWSANPEGAQLIDLVASENAKTLTSGSSTETFTGTGTMTFTSVNYAAQTHNYTLGIYYPNDDTNQNANQGKAFSGHITYNQVQ